MAEGQQFSRILDANANRAREGLRTAEDYVRFLTGDLNHAERLRLLRQALTETLHAVPGLDRELIEARNVADDPLQPENWKDVLRKIDRETPLQIAQRGLKRAQEALRVLEEYLRGTHAAQAERIAKLRYGAYDAEQWLVCASPAMQVLQTARVYVLLTTALCKNHDVVAAAQACLKGGVKVLQLREKSMEDCDYFLLSKKIRCMCENMGAIFFCNDRVDLSLLTGANGVHLGQTDISLQEARRVSGRRLLIGRSTHTVEQARKAVEFEKADYIGIGSMYETQTKAKPFIAGLKLAEEVAALKLTIPVFAIGGITLARAKELKSAGVTRVAVSQAVLGADDPEVEARRLVEAFE